MEPLGKSTNIWMKNLLLFSRRPHDKILKSDSYLCWRSQCFQLSVLEWPVSNLHHGTVGKVNTHMNICVVCPTTRSQKIHIFVDQLGILRWPAVLNSHRGTIGKVNTNMHYYVLPFACTLRNIHIIAMAARMPLGDFSILRVYPGQQPSRELWDSEVQAEDQRA